MNALSVSKRRITAAATFLGVLAAGVWVRAEEKEPVAPIRALMITGGCCHDYPAQKKIISEGISARANVQWKIVHDESTAREHKVPFYGHSDWAEGYDIVVHNECYGYVDDPAFIENVVAPHRKGVPAVVIHCSMHTFRMCKTDEWREFLGVTSRRHGPQQPLEVKNLASAHPIMKGFPSAWKTGKEELYAIEKLWPGTTPLAQAYAVDNKKDHAVIWTHLYGQTRVFGTTLAHHNKTMEDPIYLNMLTRGLLWACDKLDDNGEPKPGYEAPAKNKK